MIKESRELPDRTYAALNYDMILGFVDGDNYNDAYKKAKDVFCKGQIYHGFTITKTIDVVIQK